MLNKLLNWGNFGKENEDRGKIIVGAAILAITLDFLLALLKIFLFIFTASVSIFADSINNISDSISALIVLVGTKISEKPGDSTHPYGHGRVEYIIALIVSILVFFVGLQFMKVSIERIISPQALNFSTLSIILMLISALVKIYMVYFYNSLSKVIHSIPIKAQAKDYLADVFISVVILSSMLVYKYLGLIIDGYVGLLISLFMIYNGYELISESLSEIIGKVPQEFVKNLAKKIKSYPHILGVHDIIVTNYGTNKIFVKADVEMDYKHSLLDAHKIIDDIERDINKEYDCDLSLHIDPIGSYSKEEELIASRLKKYIEDDQRIKSFHDLYYENNQLKVDIVVDGNLVSSKEADTIKATLARELLKIVDCDYQIHIDRYF